MTENSLNSALNETTDSRAKVDLYNRYLAVAREVSPHKALPVCETAISLSHTSAYTKGLCLSLIHRCFCYSLMGERGRVDQQIGHIKQLHHEDPDWEEVSMYFFQLLAIYACCRNFQNPCSDYSYRGLALSRGLGNGRVTAWLYICLGKNQTVQKHYGEAERFYRRALEYIEPEILPRLYGRVHSCLGAMFALKGEATQARKYYHRGYEVLKTHAFGSMAYGDYLEDFASFEEDSGNLSTAEVLFNEAVNSALDAGYEEQSVPIKVRLAQLLINRGNREGELLLEEQIEPLKRSGDKRTLLDLYDILSRCYHGRGEYRKTSEMLLQVKFLSRELLKEKSMISPYENEQWTRSRENFTRASEMGRKMVACQDREGIFQVLEESLWFLKEDDALFIIEEKGKNRLEIVFGRIGRERMEVLEFPRDVSSSLASYCLYRDQSLLIDDLPREEHFFTSRPALRLNPLIDGFPVLSVLNCVYQSESSRGVISLQSPRKGVFDFHQLEYIKSLLPLMTIALDNADKTRLIRSLSTLDSLTGLLNRREFENRLTRQWSSHRRSESTLSLLLIDIDFFKRVNDEFGHPAGDEALRHISRLIRESFQRNTDICCRYGGEEFIIFSGYTDEEMGYKKAEDLRRRVEEHFLIYEGREIRFTISIGFASLVPSDELGLNDLTRFADEALYKAKALGRNRVIFSSELSSIHLQNPRV